MAANFICGPIVIKSIHQYNFYSHENEIGGLNYNFVAILFVWAKMVGTRH